MADYNRHRLGFSLNYMQRDPSENFPLYSTHKCMVRKHLTPEMYASMYKRVTANGVTLDKVIQPSVDATGDVIGLIAGDEESYATFSEIFDAVIDDKHGGFKAGDKHPPPDLDASKLVGGQMDPKYVRSCRIRTGRGVKGLCFPPAMSRAERREVERVVTEALAGLDGDLAGKYYPLTKMTPAEEKGLIEDHFLFQKPTGHLMVNSNSVRDWPDARGIWHNNDKSFLIWLNEEDHVRVIAMQKDSNMQAVFERFSRGLTKIEGLMKKNNSGFMLSERLGYLCACPSNIGTGLRCSTHVQLKHVSKHPKWDEICMGLQLQWRGTGGEHTAAVDDVYDVSNRNRLKKSEREFVQVVIDGVNKLIEMDKALAAGKCIDNLLPAGAKTVACCAAPTPFKFVPEMNFPLYASHKCMVRKHLTQDMYANSYKRITANGVTLDKCIQPSVDATGDVIGLIAGDEESYTTFHEIFDAVINDKHGGFGAGDKHPPPDLDSTKLVGGQMDPKYVRSCRIRTGRGVKGLCFPPSTSRAERREVERVVTEALAGLGGDLAGKYYPLTKMTPAEEKGLIEDHFLFQKPTGHLMQNSNSVRDWPDARGIWHNNDKSFLIWLNEEDHVRVIAMQKDSNMQAVFERFGRGLKQIEGLMKKNKSGFMLSDRLGYLCACPSNIGTGLRCSTHVQLKHVSKHAKWDQICMGLELQWRGTGGEHTAAVDDVYDVSNRNRLKKTERGFVQTVIDGVNKLIAMDKRLADRKSIDDLMPPGC